jgi:hypothetical protein
MNNGRTSFFLQGAFTAIFIGGQHLGGNNLQQCPVMCACAWPRNRDRRPDSHNPLSMPPYDRRS